MKRMGMRVALVAAGIVITVALVAGVFFRFDSGPPWHLVPRFSISGWLAALPSHLPWVVPMLILAAAAPALRAWLCGTTLRAPPPSYADRFVGIALGALMNNAVPGRLGLLGSAYVLARRASRSVSETLASLLLAKLIEFAALVAVTAALLGAMHAIGMAPAGFARPVAAGGIALLVFVTATVLLARRTSLGDAPGTKTRFPRRVGLFAELRAGLEAVGSARRLAAGFGIGLLLVVAPALGYGLGLAHTGAPVGILGGALVLAVLTLGQMTPGLPVGPGIHYAVVAWAARCFGVSAGDAAALAALSHTATVVANITVGGVTAFAQRRQLGALIPRRGKRRDMVPDPPAALATAPPAS
jgi:hypothetical protein